MTLVELRPHGIEGQAGAGVSYCPRCGADMTGPESFVQEFWVANETMYHCWCRACKFVWNLVEVERIVTHEAAD